MSSTTQPSTWSSFPRSWWLAGGMLGLALGYFLWHPPYRALTKALTGTGPIASALLRARAGRPVLLFVCGGNTCRSAMAEAIARAMLAAGLTTTRLTRRWRVRSAGVNAQRGAPMSGKAVVALQELGVPANRHRARQLTPKLIAKADIIYCMTNAQRQAVLTIAPTAADKTTCLDPTGDILDPHGHSQPAYYRCAKRIHYMTTHRLVELGNSPSPAPQG